jgi:hypothetical protein
MKKIATFALLFLTLLVFASCVVVVKKPARWAIVNTYGNVDVIKVWSMDGLAGESIAVLKPGTRVKILRIRPNAVLIELPNGNTGWVNRRHFGRDLEMVP